MHYVAAQIQQLLTQPAHHLTAQLQQLLHSQRITSLLRDRIILNYHRSCAEIYYFEMQLCNDIMLPRTQEELLRVLDEKLIGDHQDLASDKDTGLNKLLGTFDLCKSCEQADMDDLQRLYRMFSRVEPGVSGLTVFWREFLTEVILLC